jgi:iron complex transport system ATP-binding protein
MLSAQNISYKIGLTFLLKETSLQFAGGGFHVIMGANGAGKSTLLKILAGDYQPSSGNVFFDKQELQDYSKIRLAKKRAVLSQHYHLSFPITVEEIVFMGRYPYFLNRPSATDREICKKAMALMDVTHLAEREYSTLSGGEAQKVQMSRVLAQVWNEGEERKLLFLDEPVSQLDVRYQHQLLQIAKELCKKGLTVIAILHDLNLAIKFADRILLMKEGKICYQLDDAKELSSAIIYDIYGIETSVFYREKTAKPIVIF